MREAATWFDALELNDTDKTKIARTNAQNLMRL
jgi:predicted TIM-barrel fold metal-dependent hydrolase